MKSFTDKNIIACLVIASVFILMLTPSCQKAPINGDLDGQWQVMSVDPEPVDKPISQRIYYCFYLHTCQLTFYGGVFATANMIYDGKTLSLDFPYADSELSIRRLCQYGINENPITFTVDHLDKKSLILRHGDTTVTMRKF